MRIDTLRVQNFLGVGAVTLAPHDPVVMVAGPNGAGKTSLYQALRLALLGDVPRVNLMRDAGALLKAGAERGLIQVTIVSGGIEGVRVVSLPLDRKPNGGNDEFFNASMRWVLDPHAFAELDAKERMKTVLSISGAGMGREEIVRRLAAHEVDKVVIDELAPQLVLGFEKTAEIAKLQAAGHRGAWRLLTGEPYGSKKAEHWRVPASGVPPDAPMSIDAALAAEVVELELLTRLQADKAAAEFAKECRARDGELAARVQPLRGAVAALEVTANGLEVHEVTCPHCQVEFNVSDDFKAVPVAANLPALVQPAEKAKARTKLASVRKELVAAEAAAARLADPASEILPPTEAEIAMAQQRRDEAADLVRSIRAKWVEYQQIVGRLEQDKNREGQAGVEHKLVQAWEKAEVALSPGGIPSELMTAALTPLRAALRTVCASPAVASWPLPDLAEDASISAWGRPYALLSRSEQYRVDLLLAAALAVVSERRIVVADEADILEPQARAELLDWLLDMTEARPGVDSTLDAAWIFLTTKQALPEAEGVSRYWIVDGASHATQ